ncbi:unnamed protein product [Rodentolepis nana]|uniref:LSDAT_euk domain-containing protein n=1 Tax=Rodentolepis nana TaxID=102285 RepID=A0A0R3T267_RODNA|nr:unnamed protein product [Rodentolepis nana]
MSFPRLRRIPSVAYNSISPLNLNVHIEGDNGDAAYYGITGTTLPISEISRLVDIIRRDATEELDGFPFEMIQNLKINVVLSQLPCSEYMSQLFWKILHGVNLLQLACILSAHSIMDVLLNSKIKRIQTNEDVTSVHIYAAMGDYIALRKLTMAEFNITQQDKFGKLPIDYCWNYSLQDIRDFLIAQSKAPSADFVEDNDESDVEFASTEQEAQETNSSMALKFEAYLCTQVNPLYCYKGHTYCECCDDAYDHESFSGNAVLDKLIASRKDRFIKRPTNTFGQFETPCSSVMAEASSFVAWIITDGQYGSISEVMSMGMPGYAEAYGLKRLQVIGIVPWRRLPFQANLRSSNYMGSTQVEFPPKGHKSELHTPLAPYHTRYLFVDSGSRNDIHCIQEFRTMFEVWLTKVTFQTDNCNLTHNTPVCGILVTGRPEDALGVCEALKNNIPFVIIAVSISIKYCKKTKLFTLK